VPKKPCAASCNAAASPLKMEETVKTAIRRYLTSQNSEHINCNKTEA
jgi:hypothetical protein